MPHSLVFENAEAHSIERHTRPSHSALPHLRKDPSYGYRQPFSRHSEKREAVSCDLALRWKSRVFHWRTHRTCDSGHNNIIVFPRPLHSRPALHQTISATLHSSSKTHPGRIWWTLQGPLHILGWPETTDADNHVQHICYSRY